MKGIKRFVQKVLKLGEFEGCCYQQIGTSKNGKDIYLVFAWVDELGLCAKLAINDSSLQCDYDYDWSYLISNDEYIGWEESLINISAFDLEKFCEKVNDAYNYAKKFDLIVR